MTVKEYVRRRFALSENGYRNLLRATLSCVVYDVSLIVPVMILFILVCDVMGGNAYDYDLEPWNYLLMCAISLAFMYVTYRWQYNRTYFDTYKESAETRIALAEKLRN